VLLRKALVRPYLEYANSVWHHPYRMRLIGDPEIESHQVSHFNIPPQIQGKMVFLDDSGVIKRYGSGSIGSGGKIRVLTDHKPLSYYVRGLTLRSSQILLWKINVRARTLVRQLPDLPDR